VNLLLAELARVFTVGGRPTPQTSDIQPVVHAELELLGQPVFVVSLEHPAELTFNYEDLTMLYGRAT